MASHSLVLRIDPVAAAGAQAEGIDAQGVIQLGAVSHEGAIAINETFFVRHDAQAPIYNLALEADTLPAWLSSLLITPTGVLVPPIPGPIPGPVPAPFIPSVNPVIGPAVYVLPQAPVPLLSAPALLATAVPGGFGHFSMPSTMYGFSVVGATNPSAAIGLYHFNVYVTASFSPTGLPRQRIGKLQICAVVQPKDPYDQAEFVPEDKRPPAIPQE